MLCRVLWPCAHAVVCGGAGGRGRYLLGSTDEFQSNTISLGTLAMKSIYVVADLDNMRVRPFFWSFLSFVWESSSYVVADLENMRVPSCGGGRWDAPLLGDSVGNPA
jgi:hypothetical protein